MLTAAVDDGVKVTSPHALRQGFLDDVPGTRGVRQAGMPCRSVRVTVERAPNVFLGKHAEDHIL